MLNIKKMIGRLFVPILLMHIIGALAFYGWYNLYGKGAKVEDNTGKGPVIVYTARNATTPQIPLLLAIKDGFAKERGVEIRYWKDFEDLRLLVLAGKGDIWLGHVDGLALAASLDAPVNLVAVTGWKKFYFVSTESHKTVEELDLYLEKNGENLAVAPKDSPAIDILQGRRNIAHDEKASYFAFNMIPYNTQQLSLELINGNVKHALLPEPVLTVVLKKQPNLFLIGNFEEYITGKTGSDAVIPYVGVAVNSAFLRDNPALVAELADKMKSGADSVKESPEKAISVLPEETIKELGREIILESFSRDLFLVKALWESGTADEVNAFITKISQNSVAPERKIPASFLVKIRPE